MQEFKTILSAFLFAQIYVVPFIVIGKDIKLGLLSEFTALIILVTTFVALKLLGF